MSCCGSKRAAVGSGRHGQWTAAGAKNPEPLLPVEFEYIGRSTLRVGGVASRRDYWFGQPGARVHVDGNDAPSLDGVASLRRVRRAARET